VVEEQLRLDKIVLQHPHLIFLVEQVEQEQRLLSTQLPQQEVVEVVVGVVLLVELEELVEVELVHRVSLPLEILEQLILVVEEVELMLIIMIQAVMVVQESL
jgi:hypothetical protein